MVALGHNYIVLSAIVVALLLFIIALVVAGWQHRSSARRFMHYTVCCVACSLGAYTAISVIIPGCVFFDPISVRKHTLDPESL